MSASNLNKGNTTRTLNLETQRVFTSRCCTFTPRSSEPAVFSKSQSYFGARRLAAPLFRLVDCIIGDGHRWNKAHVSISDVSCRLRMPKPVWVCLHIPPESKSHTSVSEQWERGAEEGKCLRLLSDSLLGLFGNELGADEGDEGR